MKMLSALLAVVFLAACSGGGGGGGGKSGGADSVSMQPTALIGEEKVTTQDVRLDKLCKSSQDSRNKIDPRFNSSLKFLGVLSMGVTSPNGSGQGTGTWNTYINEVTPTSIKYKVSTNFKLTASNGREGQNSADVLITRTCPGDKPCTTLTDGRAGTPNELIKMATLHETSIGKLKLGDKEYTVVKQVLKGNLPVTTEGRSLQTYFDAEVISVPELPSFSEGMSSDSRDCGFISSIKMSVFQATDNIKVNFSLVLASIEGEVTKVPETDDSEKADAPKLAGPPRKGPKANAAVVEIPETPEQMVHDMNGLVDSVNL